MTTGTATIQRVTATGGWRGIGGLTLAEVRRWLPWRALAVLLAGLGVLAAVFAIWWAVGSAHQETLRLGALMYSFFVFWSVILTLVVASAAQSAVAGEVEDGTAAWLVGMPIGRPAFITAKVLGAVPGVLAAVFATGLAAYPVLSYASGIRIEDFELGHLMDVVRSGIASEGFAEMPATAEYLGLLFRMSLFMIVLVALMVLLGSMLRSQALVLGIGVVVAIGLLVAGVTASGSIVDLTPAGLISGLIAAVRAEPASLAGPVLASVLWIAGLTALAVASFSRREL